MDEQALVSVVVPTRNESGNVHELLRRLAGLRPGIVGEVLFVDDSDDDTPEVIAGVSGGCPFPVRVLHREPSQRGDGLAGAVILGFADATGAWLCVLDGDLQHPPEVIVDLIDTARELDADLVCATRYADGGDRGGLDGGRQLVSRASTVAARALFPRSLAGISDPMSGYFLVRRDALDLARVHPRGFKILLELLVNHPDLRRAEVPFRFDRRVCGESKAGIREGLTYLRRLLALRASCRWAPRPRWLVALGFALVGATGIVVNLVALVLLVAAGLGYMLAAALATQVAIAFNYWLLERAVFSASPSSRPWQRFGRYWTLSTALLVAGLPLLWLVVSGLGIHYALGNLLVIGVLFICRFVVSDRLIWARPARSSAPAPRDFPMVEGEQVAA